MTIYGVSTVAFGFNSEGEKNLTKLAEETGGRVEYPLEGVYKDVIGYLEKPSDEGNYAMKVGTGRICRADRARHVPGHRERRGRSHDAVHHPVHPGRSEDAKAFRNIKVTVPDLPTVKVRTRKGYYRRDPAGIASMAATGQFTILQAALPGAPAGEHRCAAR